MKDKIRIQTSWAIAILFSVAGLTLIYNTTQPAPKEQVINVVFDFNAQPVNGSVLFWQDSLLVKPILKHTGSPITHAAVILDGFVWEAVPPRVHKVLLTQYLKEMEAKKGKPAMQRRGFTYFIIQPKVPYSLLQVALMRHYAESQLGRPYMLRGWGKGHEVRGIFCSQYAGNILERGGRIKSDSIRESPGSLYHKLEPIYTLYTR